MVNIVYAMGAGVPPEERANAFAESFIFYLIILLIGYLVIKKFTKEKGEKKREERLKLLLSEGVTQKNAGLSAIFSFFIPGLGQMFNGEITRGIIFVCSYAICWGFFIASTGLPGASAFFFAALFPIIISSIYDSYIMATAINKFLDVKKYSGTKKCPYCAELIQEEAIVCRYCNRDLNRVVNWR